ncbi:hypothetical protein MVEN_01190400 [Mycena venus]|uniref:Uncharacterized protein n=1 Tax=Mycena venus TaxID=2733690 RepID=A0A8H6Y5M3_9AGAR|nr:hypothetical protein MVEN_01190400 [Mycena venus]
MLFFQLLFFTVSVSAAFLYSERDIESAEADLMNITTDLANIDTELSFFTPGNINAAINIDDQFEAVSTFTRNASLWNSQTPQLCVSQNGAATPDDADGFINMAEGGYIPVILDVLNKTVAAREAFAATNGFVPVILKDLIAYNVSNSLYLANLTLGAPPEFKPLALNIIRNITMAFNKAIAAYSD